MLTAAEDKNTKQKINNKQAKLCLAKQYNVNNNTLTKQNKK